MTPSFLTVDVSKFIKNVLEALEAQNDNEVEALLCGAVKHLKHNRAKPEPALYLSLMYLAKTRAHMFGSEVVIDVSL